MSRGGRREGAGRKPDTEVQKLRADLRKRLPTALAAADAIIANPEHPQHAQMTRWAIDKVAANLKPQTEPVTFDLLGDSPAEHARSIVEATAAGTLSPSIATELLTAVASCMKIVEVTELLARIEALEKAKAR